MVDPAIAHTARLGLALLFGAAVLHKLSDLAAFQATFRDYRVVPDALTRPLASVVVGAEIALSCALLVPSLTPVAAPSALALLALYSGAIGLNLLRGRRHIDCGCLGPAHRQPIRSWLLARNAVLALVAGILFAQVGSRPLHWIDALSIAASLATLSLVWIAVHQLGALPERSA